MAPSVSVLFACNLTPGQVVVADVVPGASIPVQPLYRGLTVTGVTLERDLRTGQMTSSTVAFNGGVRRFAIDERVVVLDQR